MTTSTISNARQVLPEIVNKVAYGGERVCFTRRGKPVAVMVSVDDLRLIEFIEDELDVAAARKALTKKGKTITLEQLKKRLRR